MTAHLRDARGTEVSMAHGLVVECDTENVVYRRFGKRLFDITFVLLTAPVGLSLVAIAAILAIMSGVKPFYLQRRVGLDGRIFKMLKIRSMVENADVLLEEYLQNNPEARQEWDEKQKLSNDPRITRVGSLLRRTSLDELPQLWNVLIGDMSIVGPRPIMESQRALYLGRDYEKMRPGITGAWQITDRSEGEFAGRAKHDTAYWQNMSLAEDLRILSKTVGTVVRCTGK